MSTIYDTILWLRSLETAQRFPMVEFSADTDMPTQGWISLTSLEKPEVVIAQVTAEEMKASRDDFTGHLMAEKRINETLRRSDLRCVWLIRAEDQGPNGADMSFQDFLEAYQPPRLLYRDIFTPDGEAEEDASETRAEFEGNGGRVLVIP